MGLWGDFERQVKKKMEEITLKERIEELEANYDDLKEYIKQLEKMNGILSGKIFNILQKIDKINGRIDDCESNLYN